MICSQKKKEKRERKDKDIKKDESK
jgi:hypothetical protein